MNGKDKVWRDSFYGQDVFFFCLNITFLNCTINNFISLIIDVTIITMFGETTTPASNHQKTTALEFNPSETTNKQ